MKGAGYAVFATCGYECLALASRGRIPTITRIAWRHRDSFWPLQLICAGLVWLGWHLLVEGDS